MRRVTGVDETGNRIGVVHPLADLLRERANAGGPELCKMVHGLRYAVVYK